MALDRATADQAVVVLTGGQGVFSVGLERTTERLA
jgi:enoyl-CoA hydratase/carnithine racemase